jgi:hypothetical protein
MPKKHSHRRTCHRRRRSHKKHHTRKHHRGGRGYTTGAASELAQMSPASF